MRNEILKLIQEKPKHYAVLIRKNEAMMQWVMDNSKISLESSVPAHIYSAVYGVDNICQYGNSKRFDRLSTGFVNCGPANKCHCTKEQISKGVSDTKKRYSATQKQKTNEKRNSTMIEKYGVRYNSQREDKKHIWKKPKIEDKIHALLTNKDWLYEEYITKQRSTVDIAQELGIYYSTVATYCIQHGFSIRRRSNYSITEKEVSAFLTENGVDHECGDWSVLTNKELDIYIPNHRLAIEINGLYWHSYNDPNLETNDRHLQKTKEAASKNVRLIHITDWEWKNKQDIIKSMLLNILGKTSNKIHARQCSVVRINTDTAKPFLEQMHLSGHINSTHYYGLVYNNELVMVMTLGHNRFSKEEIIEIHRIATKLHTTVVGGASRLLNHIKKELTPNKIITYCDMDKSVGNVYRQLGFISLGETGPGYFWTDGTEVISRHKAMKVNLKKWLDTYDPTKTERDNMINAGFRRYWNCGNLKFVWQADAR